MVAPAIALGVGQVAAGIGGAKAARKAGRQARRGLDVAGQTIEQSADEALTHIDQGTNYALGVNQPYAGMGIGAMANVNSALGLASPRSSFQAVDYDSQLTSLQEEQKKMQAEIDLLTKIKGSKNFNKKGYSTGAWGEQYKGLHRDQIADKIREIQSKVEQVGTKLTGTQRLAEQQRQTIAQFDAQEAAQAEGGGPTQQIRPFEFSGDNFSEDPGYQFRLNQGLEALDRQYAARGGLGSGNRMIGITDYAQGMASQEYQNSFDRALTQWRSQFDVLNANLDVLGIGRRAAESNIGAVAGGAGTAAEVLMNKGGNIAGLHGQRGGIDAAATMGRNNALQQMLGQVANIGGQAGWFDDDSATTSDPVRRVSYDPTVDEYGSLLD